MNKIHNLSQATGAILLLTVIFVSVTQSVLSLFAIEFQWILPVAAGAAAVLTSIWSDYYLTALKGIAMSLLMLAAAVAWKFAMPSLDMMGVLLMEASAFILFDLIGKIGRPSPAGSRRALVMLFICNPAVLSTVYREGTDMTFYYCMLITVALVYQLWYHGRLRDWVLLTGTVIVAFSNGKDIIVLEGCVLLLAILWCAVNRRKAFAWKLLLAGTLSLIFAFCIYGYNPAVSDFIAQGYVLPGHGEPVYPRAEESGIYLEYNRFTMLLISLIDLAHPFRGSWSHGFPSTDAYYHNHKCYRAHKILQHIAIRRMGDNYRRGGKLLHLRTVMATALHQPALAASLGNGTCHEGVSTSALGYRHTRRPRIPRHPRRRHFSNSCNRPPLPPPLKQQKFQ